MEGKVIIGNSFFGGEVNKCWYSSLKKIIFPNKCAGQYETILENLIYLPSHSYGAVV